MTAHLPFQEPITSKILIIPRAATSGAILRAVAAPIEVHDERDVSDTASHELIDFETFAFGTKARLLSLAKRIAALLPPPPPMQTP